MRRYYYNNLLKKLEAIQDYTLNTRRTPRIPKITLRVGNHTIATLSRFELEDLYCLWKDKAIEKWGINPG